ncbi:SUF system NifU family Fe-S cluster assembly protein [bacterium]|jgi:nitrogen fixation protein NifU and related proteins|nr:SUF system NifU family Fe-S cluster assembly protein [bacterium]
MNLKRLYQETILSHNKSPKNFRVLDDCTHEAHGKNPLCGDDFFVYVKVEGNKIADIGFQGQGCAISKASASLMTHYIKGKSLDVVEKMKNCFIESITQEDCSDECKETLGPLFLFEGVRDYPVRVKCAALIWRALESALSTESINKEVSTE